MDGYISKPLDSRQFFDMVESQGKSSGASPGQPPALPSQVFQPDMLKILGRPKAEELARVFLQGVERLRQRADHALGQQDWPEVAACAHSLKGSLGVFHAPDILQAINDVESVARQGQGAQTRQTWQTLSAILDNFLSRLSQTL